MLKTLYIDHYALIDQLKIDLDKGFSVITGETGAGKSIILGALALVLGQRADAKAIRQGENKCTIEAAFDISNYDLKDLFERCDWEYDPQECIIRREIWANGKSRTFVNDSPVYLNDLKELGDKLIDVHSQHQNLSLNDNIFQLNVLDIAADTKDLKTQYREAFEQYREAEHKLNDLIQLSEKSREEEEYLRFQHSALEEARLQQGEQTELEAELDAISHSEEIKAALFKLTSSFTADEQGVETTLRATQDALRAIQAVMPKAGEFADRIESAYIDLKDVRMEAEAIFETVEFDPQRMQFIEERLNLIFDLQKRHGVQTGDELIDIHSQLAEKLQAIDSFDEQITELQAQANQKRQAMTALAQSLSDARRAAIPAVEEQLTLLLTSLSMPNAVFRITASTKEQPDANGADDIQFLFSANRNTQPQPVAKVASGGEISRLMLCIKSLMAGSTALPTIIFDEIDTGTSGEAAYKMASMMRNLSRNMQVVAITHLPQIAAKADTQYIVYKEDRDDTTSTYMRQLRDDERVTEIARMLSGAQITQQAIANAEAMMKG